jgi:hypothetical protein
MQSSGSVQSDLVTQNCPAAPRGSSEVNSALEQPASKATAIQMATNLQLGRTCASGMKVKKAPVLKKLKITLHRRVRKAECQGADFY